MDKKQCNFRRFSDWKKGKCFSGVESCCELYALHYTRDLDFTGSDLVLPRLSEVSDDFILNLIVLFPNSVRVGENGLKK